MAVNAYIPLDLMKPTPTVIDLSGNFNGRVGDSESYTKLAVKSNGLVQDMTSKTMFFAGIDPAGSAKKIFGTAKADQLGDNLQTGRLSFYFPAGTFQAEGTWDTEATYFGITDEAGTVISSVNVSLTVLGNKVDMNVNSEPFYTELEKVIADGKAKLQVQLDEVKKQIDADTTSVTDPTSALNVGIAAMQRTIAAIQVQIDAKDFVDSATFKTWTDKLTAMQASLKATDKAKINASPIDYITAHPADFVRETNNAVDIGITADMLPPGEVLGVVTVDTDVPGADNTAGWPTQTAKCTQTKRPVVLVRKGTADATWSAWEAITTW